MFVIIGNAYERDARTTSVDDDDASGKRFIYYLCPFTEEKVNCSIIIITIAYPYYYPEKSTPPSAGKT